MRVAVLATGGKDSALALYKVLSEGHEVTCLATMIPLREDSWMFHYPNIRLVALFAEAAEIPLVKAETSGIKEKEVEDLERLVAGLGIDGLVSGAIASEYQKKRVDKICGELELKCLAPLWHKEPLDILKEIMTLHFEVIMTGVYAYGFGQEWLGRKVDEAAIDDLTRLNEQYGVSLVGEGGEYETLVLDAPFLKKKIVVVRAEKVWKGQSGYYLINEARLANK
jgi:diphthine-ammonia ligase